MVNKHFLKTLVLFTSLIVFGLLVIFVVSYLDEQEDSNTELSENTPTVAN